MKLFQRKVFHMYNLMYFIYNDFRMHMDFWEKKSNLNLYGRVAYIDLVNLSCIYVIRMWFSGRFIVSPGSNGHNPKHNVHSVFNLFTCS